MLCLTLEIENTYGAKLWLERIFCLGMFIFAIFCGFNYLNVQNILPLCKSKNRFLHYVGIILLDVAVIFCSICDYVHYRVCCISYKMILYIIAHKNKPCSHRYGGNMAYIIFSVDFVNIFYLFNNQCIHFIYNNFGKRLYDHILSARLFLPFR